MSYLTNDQLVQIQEQSYELGAAAAWRRMLQEACRELGVNDAEAGRVRWILERGALVASLRRACEEFGDNNWPENAHLDDVFQSHLERHLWERLADKEKKG